MSQCVSLLIVWCFRVSQARNVKNSIDDRHTSRLRKTHLDIGIVLNAVKKCSFYNFYPFITKQLLNSQHIWSFKPFIYACLLGFSQLKHFVALGNLKNKRATVQE